MTKSEIISNKLHKLLDKAVKNLRLISPESATLKRSASIWSVKEILGHLLDSAVNNHLRFIRVQQEDDLVLPSYEQMFWVSSQRYNEKPWGALIDLWYLYNKHLAHVIRYIPSKKLGTTCTLVASKSTETVTLEVVLEGYLSHLQHHLEQIDERSVAPVDPAMEG